MKPVLAVIAAYSPGFHVSAQSRPEQKSPDENNTVQRSFDRSKHTIRPGDKLSIRVWREASLSTTVCVDKNGEGQLPAMGSMVLEGHTTSDLADIYARELRKRFNSPQVSIIFLDFTPSPSCLGSSGTEPRPAPPIYRPAGSIGSTAR